MTSGPMLPPTPGRLSVVVGDTRAVRAWAALAVHLAARVYRSFLLTLLVAVAVPLLWNWSDHVVRSGSMEPSISVGDVVVAKPFHAHERVPVGRVMIFSNPATPDHPETLVHRVVDKAEKGSYVTKGDANRSNDTTPVTRDLFQARATILIPFVGKPFTWWATGDLVPLLAWMLLTSVCFVLARRSSGSQGDGDTEDDGQDDGQDDGAPPAVRRTPLGRLVVARLGRLVPFVALLSAGSFVALSAGSASAAFTDTTVNRGMDWTVSPTLTTNLVLASPGDPVRGTVPVTATLANSYGLTFAVRIESAPAGTTSWQTMCVRSTAPYSCSWATAGLANQDYDLRAVATSGSTTYTSKVVTDVSVDNAAPTITMQDPGSPLRGTITLAATAADAHSGVAKVVFEYAVTGSTTWQTACSATQQPWSCSFSTALVPDGSYAVRAVATDVAGNAATSAAVTNRIIDNSISSITLTDPGAYLSGTVSLTANASSTAGVASVRIQRASAGSSIWSDVCLDITTPYGCGFNTTLVAEGAYDLRAILTDGAGRTITSATVANRRIDNTAPRGFDVQTTNGGTTIGRPDPGDALVLTYSEQMKPASISPGWDGTAQDVTLRLRDGSLVGLSGKNDTVDVLRNGSTLNLGSVNLREDFVTNGQQTLFAATMTASTTTVNGVSATRVTITLGAVTSGGANLRTTGFASTMTWSPSNLATDLAGLAAQLTAVNELGLGDREF